MNFLAKTAQFFSPFHGESSSEKILVEESIEQLFIDHCIITQALMISNAKKYQPLFIKNNTSPSLDFLHSFIPTAQYHSLKAQSRLKIKFLKICCLLQVIKIFLFQNVLSFKYKNIGYGDLLYDTYLAVFRMSTINLNNKATLYMLYNLSVEIAIKHEQILEAITSENIVAILTYQMVSIPSTVLWRVAEKCGCEIYINVHGYSLRRFVKKEKVIYPLTPTKDDIDIILQLKDFEKKFEIIHDMHINGFVSRDASYAFTGEQNIWRRDRFCSEYNIDVNKKNILIMLHAFTDYPHSHFEGMLFKDYYDWFIQTLSYAKNDRSVNWIFKRHPSEKFYPVNDMDFAELFSNVPDNVALVNAESKIDTRSLQFIADTVITCIGSAGFEMPALYGIPAIVAGANHYSALDFVVLPKTIKEYFSIVGRLKDAQKIGFRKQRIAQAFYMFIYYYALVPYSFLPQFTLEDNVSKIENKFLFKKILDLYETKKQIIYSELKTYIDEISKDSFKALRRPII